MRAGREVEESKDRTIPLKMKEWVRRGNKFVTQPGPFLLESSNTSHKVTRCLTLVVVVGTVVADIVTLLSLL
eukprot:5835375-Amphidinium_carterae.1